jgi:hypothetical protein
VVDDDSQDKPGDAVREMLPRAEVIELDLNAGYAASITVAFRAQDSQRGDRRARSALSQVGLGFGELIRARRGPAHQAGVLAAITARAWPPDRSVADPSQQDDTGFIRFAAQDWWYRSQAHTDFQLMREVTPTRRVQVVNSLGLRVTRRRKPKFIRRALADPGDTLEGYASVLGPSWKAHAQVLQRITDEIRSA